jgi:hypothetical protein
MTKAQEVYERVEALVASGTRKADAFRQVADEYGQPFNSIRGSYYTHTRSLGSEAPTRSSRRRGNGDPIASAVAVLQRALESVDVEVTEAKARVEEAKTEYEQLRDSATERKAAIQAKIDVLSS